MTSPTKTAVIQVPSARQVVVTCDGKLTLSLLDAHGKPGCRPLYPHELIKWQTESGNLDPSVMPIMGTTWADLDLLDIARLKRMVDENHGDSALLDLSDLDIAKALGFVITEQEVVTLTLAGLLLVGKETVLRLESSVNLQTEADLDEGILNALTEILPQSSTCAFLRRN